MAYLYEDGQGIAQDYGKAREWYEKAAIQGYADAQNNLGLLYEKGLGVGRDYNKAREWYEKAAAQGHAGAQNNLGLMYKDGKSVAQDYGKARTLPEKSVCAGGCQGTQEPSRVVYQRLECGTKKWGCPRCCPASGA